MQKKVTLALLACFSMFFAWFPYTEASATNSLTTTTFLTLKKCRNKCKVKTVLIHAKLGDNERKFLISSMNTISASPPLEVDLTANFIAQLLLPCTGEE